MEITELILSTANCMSGSSTILRNSAFEKSNSELVNSLRANFSAAKEGSALECETNGDTNQCSSEVSHLSSWTNVQDKTLYMPSIDIDQQGLVDEPSEYDVTAKLFFLSQKQILDRKQEMKLAIKLVLDELRVPSLDLLILSFPGIAFDETAQDCEDPTGDKQRPTDGMSDMLQTWNAAEDLQSSRKVARIGIAEFGLARLTEFVSSVEIKPVVDQINLSDCCGVPTDLTAYARQQKIDLLTHNDCNNIMPRGTLRQLLNEAVGAAETRTSDIRTATETQLLGSDVLPQWVIKYTAVARDRGVIENKGYFVKADVRASG